MQSNPGSRGGPPPPNEDLMNLARAAGHNGLPPSQTSNMNSGYTTFAVPGSMFPEIALFSQFGQLFPQYNELSNQLQNQKGNGAEEVKAGLMGRGPAPGGGGGRTRSSDSRTSSAYASRHQAAEQRRRTRINERLELLRQLVPHAERANTACFLEEVIKYVDSLKRRNVELEAALGNKPATPADLPTQPIAAIAASLNKPLTTAHSTPSQAQQYSTHSQGLPIHSQMQQQPQQHSLSIGEPLVLHHHQQQHHPQQQEHKTLSLFPSTSGGPPPSKRAFLSLSEEPNQAAFAQLQKQILGIDTLPGPSAGPVMAAAPVPAHDGHPVAALDLRKPAAAAGDSPVSSEESGVPLKKRKMLVL